MSTLYDLFLILSIALGGLQLGLKGYLSTNQVLVFIGVGTILVAVSRVFKSRGRRLLLKIVISVSALLVFSINYGQGESTNIIGIIGIVLVLVLMLFGLYVMVRGPFKEK